MSVGGFSLAVHGGAGAWRGIDAQLVQGSILQVVVAGRRILQDGGLALDAVTECVRLLEDDPLYNAGCGAAPNADGEFELDASIMDGRDLSAGAVGAVRSVRNPILLARRIKERSEHVLLVGRGAEAFARVHGLETVDAAYFRRVWTDHGPNPRHGTVGAVARDVHGHLAAATSTGGLRGKLPGRVGDSALIGAATYADDDAGAVSCTGHGEDFIRSALAAYIGFQLEQRGLDAATVARCALRRLRIKVVGDGGFIVVDRAGNIAAAQTSACMPHGWIERGGPARVALRAR